MPGRQKHAKVPRVQPQWPRSLPSLQVQASLSGEMNLWTGNNVTLPKASNNVGRFTQSFLFHPQSAQRPPKQHQDYKYCRYFCVHDSCPAWAPACFGNTCTQFGYCLHPPSTTRGYDATPSGMQQNGLQSDESQGIRQSGNGPLSDLRVDQPKTAMKPLSCIDCHCTSRSTRFKPDPS